MNTRPFAGHEAVPGTVVRDHLRITGTEAEIPYIALYGAKPGISVLITAGIHCAEYVGIQAAIELSNELDVFEMRGNVIILPLVNRTGFEHRTMSVVFEDGKNLNRVFPGEPMGSMAERLAYTVFEGFIRHADAYIDLHSGDGYEALVPYVYYVGGAPSEDTARKMAACVDALFCVRSRCYAGGAYNTASVRGIPSVLIERGQLGLHSRKEINADKADVVNILRRLGVLPGEWCGYPKPELLEYGDAAPCTGCWYPEKTVGDTFASGEKLETIRDYFGRVLFTEYAPSDGVLLYQCASLNIIENGPMVTYGVPAGDRA